MQIYTLTKKHLKLFLKMIPVDILVRDEEEGYYSIGLFDDAMNMRPAGFAQFYAGYEDYNENSPILRVTYLFVEEEYRHDGNGAALLKAMKEAAVGGSSKLVVEMPLEFRDFVETNGFSVEEVEHYSFEMPLSGVREPEFVKNAPVNNIKPFSKLNKGERTLLIKSAPVEVRLYLKDESKRICDQKLSCTYWKNGRPCGVMVVKTFPSGAIEILHLMLFVTAYPGAIVCMLKYFYDSLAKYPPEQLIRIEGINSAAIRLIKKQFEDYTPEMFIRGTIA